MLNGEVWAAVYGNGTGEFLLVPLSPNENANVATAKSRGYVYFGLVGYSNGQSIARCEQTPEAVITVLGATHAFAEYVVEKLKGKIGQER